VTETGPPTDILATEVFSAIQGEAALVGERQVFVRLTGCNIRCAYCDQPEALDLQPGPCRIERTPGRRDWRVVDSPLPIAALATRVDELWRQLPHHSISLTGAVDFNQDKQVNIYPIVSGNVHDVSVQLGDFVTTGQTLATIRSSEMAGYSNNLIQAQTALTAAKKAADAGDFDQAMAQAKEAEALAKASIFQATSEKDAWKDLAIR